jgi:hypothetical protein
MHAGSEGSIRCWVNGQRVARTEGLLGRGNAINREFEAGNDSNLFEACEAAFQLTLGPSVRALCQPEILGGATHIFTRAKNALTRSPQRGASLGVGTAPRSTTAFTEFEKFYLKAE